MKLRTGSPLLRLLLTLTLAVSLAAQESESESESTTEAVEASADTPDDIPVESNDAERTEINLLGETDSSSGESRRNENVQFNLVDNNALKELNIRLGATATLVGEFDVERDYFGSEFGAPASRPVHAGGAVSQAIHGNIFATHNNSIFSARSYFQVGDVQPARENNYGGRVQLPVWKGGSLSLSGRQIKIRGQVNGNVLIPLAEERTPLTTDPQLLPIVNRFLTSYPDVAPNRPDIAARALNTNAVQGIDTDNAEAQINQSLSDDDKLTLRYAFTGQSVDAFQLVRGRNPDTDTRSHSARVTWNRAWNANTVTDFTLGFDRLGSLLVPADGARETVMPGRAITGLGPPPPIPIDRAQNRYRIGGTYQRTGDKHTVTAGFLMTRLLYNGEETDGHRGILSFGQTREVDEFGMQRVFSAIDNLRRGRPLVLIQALGTTYRGFRTWENAFFVGDKWRVNDDLTLTLGLRWEPMTRPFDVTGRSDLAFDSDLNNFAPNFGFAQRLGDRWGIVRGAFAVHYGELFPVTYGQDRLNAPNSLRIVIQNPNLADPLGGLRFEDLPPDTRSSLIEVGPDMVVPYSYQYNFSWETNLVRDWRLQLGYVGSRSHKLIQTYFLNRGQAPSDPALLRNNNINQRRANQRIFEHLFVHNGSHGYFDAVRATLAIPEWHGLSLNGSYWFSKAIDTGSNYTNTASGPDARDATGQIETDSMGDLKGLSNFDQPHAFLLQGSYRTPTPTSRGWLGKLFADWNLSSVLLLKTGTPFTVEAGSDAPGFGNADGRRSDRPMLLDPTILGSTIGDPDTSEAKLPASAFRFIDAPTELAGNLGRNTFRKGKIANVNASLSRAFPISGDVSLTFRAESINFFNTPQFAEPTTALTSPSFGQINNTLNDGRTFRFTLRLDF